jgi:hypothetical protein
MIYDSGKSHGINSVSAKNAVSLPTTKKVPPWLEDFDDDPPDTPVHQKQKTSKPQSSTAGKFKGPTEPFRRESQNPPPVGSRKGPPALGEGQRRLRAEQARKNTSPINRAAPIADTPTKASRIKPETRLKERMPSSEVTGPAHAPKKTNTIPMETGSNAKADGLQSSPQHKPPRRLLTVDDLARRWRVSPKTIRNNLSSGRLILGTKILGRTLFDLGEVIAYEKQHRR